MSLPEQPNRVRVVGRLLGVAVLGTLLGLSLAVVAAAIAFGFPGRNLGYVTGPVAFLLFGAGLKRLLRWAESKPAPPPSGQSADLPAEEQELFGATLAELRASGKAAAKQQGLTFLLSLIAFVVFGAGFNSVESLLLLIPVLLVHELGHLLAMRVFGYKDLGVFFIPLFGAAATGRKERAPAWEQVVVSLMGPAPGLLLAFGLAIAFRGAAPHPLLEQLVGLTLVLNALNLLPFEPFDGGRVASIVLFGGHPRLRARWGSQRWPRRSARGSWVSSRCSAF